jgi:hypothetical protein
MRFIVLVFTISILVTFSGCSKFTHLKYSSFVRDLDGKSELVISTYPTWYPKRTLHIPFLYENLISPEEVYFQVFVRDSVKKVGQNPNVKSIRIHSFAVQMQNQSKIILISDYESNFWMQGQSKDNKLDVQSIPYYPDTPLRVDIALTLNGVDYSIKGKMNPTKEVSMSLLIYKIFE